MLFKIIVSQGVYSKSVTDPPPPRLTLPGIDEHISSLQYCESLLLSDMSLVAQRARLCSVIMCVIHYNIGKNI